MINLALLFHMHQPYYRNLLNGTCGSAWVRLHAAKDYLDMAQILENYPSIQLNFNFVPVLLEQLNLYARDSYSDDLLDVSRKPAAKLTQRDKLVIREAFFQISLEHVIAQIPRYYELYIKNLKGERLSVQDYRDIQVWFNLAWIDPWYRAKIHGLHVLEKKGGRFTETDKMTVLDAQIGLLKSVIPAYRALRDDKRIDITVSPYAHPIMPLLFAPVREEQKETYGMPTEFSFPEDIRAQLYEATVLYQSVFGAEASGLWPPELSLSQEVMPYISDAGIRWVISDEGILFRSLGLTERDRARLYQPYLLDRKGKDLSVVFRDRILSDLIGFVYGKWKAQDAVNDFMNRLQEINSSFPDGDPLVCVALDGENAWEYYEKDGRPFLELLYQRLGESKTVRTVRIGDYLNLYPPRTVIEQLAAGSWIDGRFWKWNGSAEKNAAWRLLSLARNDYESRRHLLKGRDAVRAQKQMLICEGSDWFWWQGEDATGEFDEIFRMHLINLYRLIQLPVPEYLRTG